MQSMKYLNRSVVTPLVFGAFIFSAVTGGALFFHLGSDFTIDAHQWLGWGIIVAGIGHATINWPSIVAYLRSSSRYLVLAFILITIAAFFPIFGGDEDRPHPYALAAKAIMQLPLSEACNIAVRNTELVVADLSRQRISVETSSQSIREIAQSNDVDPVRVLAIVFSRVDSRP